MVGGRATYFLEQEWKKTIIITQVLHDWKMVTVSCDREVRTRGQLQNSKANLMDWSIILIIAIHLNICFYRQRQRFMWASICSILLYKMNVGTAISITTFMSQTRSSKTRMTKLFPIEGQNWKDHRTGGPQAKRKELVYCIELYYKLCQMTDFLCHSGRQAQILKNV